MHPPNLCYLGVVSQPECSEYHFRITNEDNTARRLVLSIAKSVFLTRQLMIQEAPDLCYQKIMADLKSDDPSLAEDFVPVTESDIEKYRASHPNLKLQRRSFRKPIE